MVRIVVGPHEVVDQAVFAGEVEPRLVFLEGGEAALAEIVAWHLRQLGAHEHVVLAVGLVQRPDRPRHPANASFDAAEAQRWEALQNAGCAQVGNRLHGRRQGMNGVVHHRAAVAPGRARIAPGGDVEGHRQIDFGDAGPERVELRQVVVQVLVVRRTPDRLAGKGEATEAQRRHALDLGNRAVEVRCGNAAHRRQLVVVRAEGLPRPVVPHPAHVLAELGIRRGPDGEALVREEHLGIHPVRLQIGQALLRRFASTVAQAVFALELDAANPHRAKPLGLLEPPPLRIHRNARQPLPKALVHARAPQVGRLLHMPIRRHHEVLVGIVGPRRTLPAFDTRRLKPPSIVRIRRRNGARHPLSPSFALCWNAV